ncbi:uncharacterized protein LOC132554695 [Ylistrum balloti]|uniref:uncharacterized protein LOC132554695 n=1 Tax=Ylistrum balloti TaxID=509963 RepID=UPI002905D5C7|nr:uncharacterized protein LOC132554695 [Ylistrum balloti]
MDDSQEMSINCRVSDADNDHHRKARKKNSTQTSRNGRPYSENDVPSRDTELPDIKKMQWTENAQGVGTIPGHMSIRVPPASIGIGGKKEKLIGITNHEVSERYILKLQRDRERNNQAVFKSLENLPITIRHVPKYRIQSEPTINTARAAVGAGTEARPSSMRSLSPEETSYQRFLNTADVSLDVKSSDANPVGKVSQELLRSEFKKSKVAGPMCPHLMPLSACRKCARLKKRRKRPDVRKETTSTVTTGILGNDLNIQAEGSGNQNQDTSCSCTHRGTEKVIYTAGFQGHQMRSTKSVKVPSKKKSLNIGLPTSGNLPFQKKYTRVFDSNQQIHFVNTSLLSGQRAGALGKTFKKLPGIRAAGESQRLRENTEVFAIKSVQRHNDPFPESSSESKPTIDTDMSPTPIPIQPMPSFASDISNMQMINLDGRVHGEPQNEDKYSQQFINTHDFNVPKSDMELQKVRETPKDRHVPLSRSSSEVLTCKSQRMMPGRTNSKSTLYSSKSGSFKTGNKTSRTRNTEAMGGKKQDDSSNRKVAQEMQFSVRIEYKQADNEPTPRESTYSEIVNMPRWVEKEKSNAESIAQKSTVSSVVGHKFHERVSDDLVVGDEINNVQHPNLQPSDPDGKSKDDVEFDKSDVSSHEIIDHDDTKYHISEVSDLHGIRHDQSEPRNDNTDTNIPAKEIRQKSSPESGFVSMPSGSEETNVEPDNITVESEESAFESEKKVNLGKKVTLSRSALPSDNEQNETESASSVEFQTQDDTISGNDVKDKKLDVSSKKDDDCSDKQTVNESPDSELGGGFFVTTIDTTAEEDTENKEIMSGSDSGIAQEDFTSLQEYANGDLKVPPSPQKVMRPPGIGIGLSHDIQA